jgi:hypothetical protein
MNFMLEDLARTRIRQRRAEAKQQQVGHRVARAARISAKAEKAAQKAKLALARAL